MTKDEAVRSVVVAIEKVATSRMPTCVYKDVLCALQTDLEFRLEGIAEDERAWVAVRAASEDEK